MTLRTSDGDCARSDSKPQAATKLYCAGVVCTGVGGPITTMVPPACAALDAAGASAEASFGLSSIVGEETSVITGSIAFGSGGWGSPVNALVNKAS